VLTGGWQRSPAVALYRVAAAAVGSGRGSLGGETGAGAFSADRRRRRESHTVLRNNKKELQNCSRHKRERERKERGENRIEGKIESRGNRIEGKRHPPEKKRQKALRFSYSM
jgi:hypothetical protein